MCSAGSGIWSRFQPETAERVDGKGEEEVKVCPRVPLAPYASAKVLQIFMRKAVGLGVLIRGEGGYRWVLDGRIPSVIC